MSDNQIWSSLKEFVVHITVGTILFVFISLIAILLSLGVAYLDSNGYNPIIVKGLAGFEYLLFGLDLFLAAVFLLRSTYKLVKEIW